MDKLKTFFIILAVILLLGGAAVGFYYFEQIPENPPGTVGNTAGNLLNAGLYCENEGKVYFANAYDNNTLYSMNPNETEFEKVTTVGVKWINAAGKFLYYYQNKTASDSGLGYVVESTGMYRVKKNGSGALCLRMDPVGDITLVNNDIFYQNLSEEQITLDKISIDKENDQTVLDFRAFPSSVYNNILYYSNYEDSLYLYGYDTTTGMNMLIWDHPVWNPIYHNDGYIYFMDVETDYQLHRYNPSSGAHEVLTTDRADTFNVYGNYIYYQKSSEDDPALKRMYTDGTGNELVSSGIYENINITSNYVYFNSFGTPTPVYHQSVNGPVNVGIFSPEVIEK